jgi:hypothetical protein
MVDGAESSIVRGDRIPVPNNVVSATTTTTIATSYNFIQTGLTITCKLRELSQQTAALDVHTENAAITDMVGPAPVVATEKFQTRAVMESGGVYLLGAMERSELDHVKTNGLRVGSKSDEQKRVLQLWGRACRVGGQVSSMEGAE